MQIASDFQKRRTRWKACNIQRDNYSVLKAVERRKILKTAREKEKQFPQRSSNEIGTCVQCPHPEDTGMMYSAGWKKVSANRVPPAEDIVNTCNCHILIPRTAVDDGM